LPFSGIAGFGLYEGTWAVVFRYLGLDGGVADVTAISHHLFTQVYGYLLGMIGFSALLFISPRTLSGVPKLSGRLLPLAVLFGVGFSLAAGSYDKSDQSAAARVEDASVHAVKPIGHQVIFDSNRGGTFGIHSIDPKSGFILPIADSSGRHEMYPDVLAKERLLVFAKSRTTSRLDPGEVWSVSLDHPQSSLQLLVSNGTFKRKKKNGAAILFERRRRRAMVYDRTSKQTEELFPRDSKAWQGYQIVKPALSADGQLLTFTSDKPSTWHIWRINLKTGEEELIARGCESSFIEGTNDLVYIRQEGGYGGSAIMRYSDKLRTSTIWFDPHRELGHEYFPKAYQAGSILVFSAAPNDQHSHLTASYALFMKTNDGTRQITHDEFTNRWPKLLLSPTQN
ncbi:MAG: PD40 domain-containing protein, partial [Bdellovibrionales bacterium]|nr:PD40 domain-containing protein [Bdellovibrionales bacterium]